MRTALIGDYPLDEQRIRGGVQGAFVYLVKELRKFSELEIHIIRINPSGEQKYESFERGGLFFHLLPIYPRFELARKYRTYQSRLNEVLLKIQPDLLHAQDASIHGYVALKSELPTVITVHGIRREDGMHRVSAKRRMHNWIHSRLIEGYNLRHTRHLIAISRYVVDYFSSQLDPDINIYFVPNAIDGSFFNIDDTSDGNTILFAGGVMLRKRVLDLLRAFSLVVKGYPSAQLRIAGDLETEPEYVKIIRNYIQTCGIKDKIHLLGPLSENSVLNEFANCNILALPSAQETTPMVIAQAMAAGKAVVSTPVGGIPEMVRDGETGNLVNVGDIEELAAVMLDLLQDEALRKNMGREGRIFAEENYRAEQVARSTLGVYQSVIKTK
jgi:glycosyltransferase involved in cell wall biosynthesis